MNTKKFKPLLAPNKQLPIGQLPYPLISTPKIDGIRMIVKNGELFTRNLKPFVNEHISIRFKELVDYTKNNNIILDGELYSKTTTFANLSGIIRSFDKVLPEDLYYYMFDSIKDENFNEVYRERLNHLFILYDLNCIKKIPHIYVNNTEETKEAFDSALNDGFEGLILRNPVGIYKFGRATLKENIIYKLKPFETYDAKIVDVIQATSVKESANKKINELGYSVTSKKKDDRELINKASAFLVTYNNLPLKVTIALTDPEKEEIWLNKDAYIGKCIEFKGMKIGSKDLPRHPVFIRYRTDKD